MTDTERTAYLKTLSETPARLKAALKGVPKKLLLWTPGPGKWSMLEIAAHMRDMERDGYLNRYRRILAEENPGLPDLDGDLIALRDNYRGMRLSEVLRDWTQTRRESLKLLKSVKGDQWNRIGTHETAGPLSMLDFLRRHAVGNDEAHLGQLEAIRKRASTFETLETGPKKIADAVKTLSDDVARRKPAPEKWSALEVVCHLRDVERLWADRIVKAAFSDRPPLYLIDVDAIAAKSEYNKQDLSASLKEYQRMREDNLRILRALPSPLWKRSAIHPKRGELTIEAFVETMMDHDAKHLGQIQRAVA